MKAKYLKLAKRLMKGLVQILDEKTIDSGEAFGRPYMLTDGAKRQFSQGAESFMEFKWPKGLSEQSKLNTLFECLQELQADGKDIWESIFTSYALWNHWLPEYIDRRDGEQLGGAVPFMQGGPRTVT